MNLRIWGLLVFACCLLAPTGCVTSNASKHSFPQKPIRVIVPFGAGGGSDTFTRILQHAILEHQLLDQPLVVINVPGAGGSIGSRKVKNARPDGYTLLQIHDGMLTNKYSGNSHFGPESFSPVAGTGQMAHVIAVREDSPFDNLTSLLETASQEPDSVVFAVGIGAPSHFAGMMLENALPHPQPKFRFTQSGGGAKRFASLLGGHSAVTTFSVAEFVDFRSSGLRALAILSGDRHRRIPDVPTAVEQGIGVRSTNMHFWWAPKGTPPDRVEKIATVLDTAMKLPEVQSSLADLATVPVFLRDEQLKQELVERERQVRAVTQRDSLDLPDFGLYVFCATLLIGVATVVRSRFGQGIQQPVNPGTRDEALLARWLVAASMVVYVLVLQSAIVDYRWATCVFVLAVGTYLSRSRRGLWPNAIYFDTQGDEPQRVSSVFRAPRDPRRAPTAHKADAIELWQICVTALLLSVGLHFVFTRVLVVDLP